MFHRVKIIAVIAMTLALSAFMIGPAAAQSRQRDKNNMRNLSIGLGALAVHQAIKGKTTNAIVLGAGAAYSLKKYEDQRKAQNRDRSRRARYSRYSRR